MWFSVLGIIIAAMLVVIVANLSQAAILQLTQQMAAFGSDQVVLLPFKISGMQPSSALSYFDEKDVKKVARLGCIKDAYGVIAIRNLPIRYGENEFFSLVLASENYLKDYSLYLPLEEGRYLRKEGEVVIGNRLAEDLGISLRDKLEIGNRSFKVVGILAPQEMQTGSINADTTLFISERDGKKLVGERFYLIIARTTCPLEETQQRLEKLFPDSTVITSDYFQKQLEKAINAFNMGTLILGVLAGGIASLGVINSMLASIVRRRKSIALMKVLGMNNKQLWHMLFLESFTLNVVGIMLGALMGIVFYEAVLWYLGWERIYVPITVLALGGMVIVGSWIPAWFGLREAKRISPKEALSS